MGQTIFIQIRFFVGIVLVMGAVGLLPACKTVGVENPIEIESLLEKSGVEDFRKALRNNDYDFLSSRYVQRVSDPFYLSEVVDWISPGQPFTPWLRNQIESRRQDVERSWPILLHRLRILQDQFTLVSWLPLQQLDVELGGLGAQASEDVEALKGTIEREIMAQRFERAIQPLVRLSVLELAQIGPTAANFKRKVPALEKVQVLRAEVCLLSPRISMYVAEGAVNLCQETFANPLKLFGELRPLYDEFFSTLAALEWSQTPEVQIDQLSKILEREKDQLADILMITQGQSRLTEFLLR